MRIKCTVSYDGSSYVGWQAQAGLHSIQNEIEKALAIIHKKPVVIHASGRTDAGVHALGQVFHFDTELTITNEKWKQAINGLLPSDIWLLHAETVDGEFHARHSCIKKTYEYRFSCGEYEVHRANYCTQLRYPVDIERIKDACTVFLGTHDFGSFNTNGIEERPYQIRTIEQIELMQEGHEYVLRFTGTGFLRYMVRMLVGSLLEVGRGRLEKETLQLWLEHPNKESCRHNAPAQGLYLKEVFYS